MPVNIIEEWADFLQEEKIIDIEFRLAKRILMIRGADKKVTEEKKKEFKNKKQQVIRKADATKAFYERETGKINSFKKDLEEVKREVEKEFGKDSIEFKKLDEYEHIKHAITQDIANEKQALVNSLNELDKQISREEEKFGHLMKQVEFGKSMLSKEKYDEQQVEIRENELKSRLDSLNNLIKEVESDLNKEKEIQFVVHDMDNFFGRIKARMEQRKIEKLETEREHFYSKLQNPSKVKHFDKLLNEAHEIIKHRKISEARGKYLELRAAYSAMANSNIDAKDIAKYFEKLYHTYALLKQLYSRHSFEESKNHIHTKTNEATERLNKIKEEYKEVDKKMNKDEKRMYKSREHIKSFEEMSKKIISEVNSRKNVVLNLFKHAQKLDDKLADTEKRVFKKVFGTERINTVMKNKENMKKYHDLFQKKTELEEMIKQINKDKQMLEHELNSLLKKTKAMSLEHSSDPQKQIDALNKMMSEIDIKKQTLENEILMFNDATKNGLS